MHLKKFASIAASVAFMLASATAAHAESVPTAPTNFSATAAGHSIMLTWDSANAFNEGVTEFDPYISADKGKTWTKTDALSGDNLTLEDTGLGLQQTVGWWGKYQFLKPLSSYQVKVVAVNATGPSLPSPILTVKMPATPPIFGFGSVGADQKQKFSKGVLVKWNLTADGGKPVTSFKVSYRAHSADGNGAWKTYKTLSGKMYELNIPYATLKAFKDFDIAVAGRNAIGTNQGECEIKVDAKGNITSWI